MTAKRKIIYPEGKITLKEFRNGNWRKTHYNEYGDVIKYESNDGELFTAKYTYDENGVELTYEDSDKIFRYNGLYVTEEQFYFNTRKLTKARYLGITEFPYIEIDKNGNVIYEEEEHGYWTEYIYDSKGRQISSYSKNGLNWCEFHYDRFGRLISIKSETPSLNEDTTYKTNTQEYARATYCDYIHVINGESVSEAKYLDFIEEINYSNSKFKPVSFEIKSIEFLKSKDYFVFKIPNFLLKLYNTFVSK